jgi:hypothetical protein
MNGTLKSAFEVTVLVAVILFCFVSVRGTARSQLAKCVAATERTILPHQAAARSDAPEKFEGCRTPNALTESFCRGVYLDTVRTCMKDAGYLFIDPDLYLSHGESPYVGEKEIKQGVCDWNQYQDPKCYRRTWWFTATHWWAFKSARL